MKKKKYKVCFGTAELAPLAKAGGLADVSGALTRLLHAEGHDVRTFLPLYRDIDRRGLAIEPVDGLDRASLQFGAHRYEYRVLRARRDGGAPEIMLVDCPALYDRPGLYGSADDEHLRFLLLSRAALDTCEKTSFAPDVVHCHDWHTALVPLYLRTVYASSPTLAKSRSVLTIHNLGYQGVLSASASADLGLGAATARLDREELDAGRINLLRQGLIDADLVSTVSPTYAREITTPEQGMGLDQVLRERPGSVVGILNGIDVEEWNPASDAYLPHHYGPGDLAGKRAMRQALCDRLGLDARADRPVVGMVSRLTWQKGIDLLFDLLPGELSAGRITLATLGSGDPTFEEFFTGLARAHPGLAAFRQTQDEELAHWIEAGSDAFLMPSRYEPCGLNQMYSLRYGTVPVVRSTGGLADSVTPFDPATGQGTGILFNDADVSAVRWALGRMCGLYEDRVSWQRMVANGMAVDLSWRGRFEQYLDLYARAAAARR